MKISINPIHTREFPDIGSYKIDKHDEPMINLRYMGFLVEPRYYLQGIEGAVPECYARESVVEMLKKAAHLLPSHLMLKIYDAYRPIQVQQSLWDMYRKKVVEESKDANLTDEEIDKKTSFFVSKPSYDPKVPSLHNTGGAVDLTLVTTRGHYALNMGCDFDDFTPKAWTNHFEEDYEEHEVNTEARENRRLLYSVMTEAGFTNLPSEWWHFDYGDKFWAYFTGNTAIYEGIDMDIPVRSR